MLAVVGYFHRNFAYRLQGPSNARSDDLRAFMKQQEGHCTLFATAATLIFRQLGIPARVVGGYLSTDRHPVTGEWVVRARDGHAWCEAWDAVAGGWRRIEATTSGGLPVGLPPPGKLRAWLEACSIGIRNVIDWARELNVLAWLAEAGAMTFMVIEDVLRTTPGKLAAAFLIAAGFALAWWRRRRIAPGAEDLLRIELEQSMKRLAAKRFPQRDQRRVAETWTEWLNRTVDATNQREAQELVDDYHHHRFTPHPDPTKIRAWISAAR
jgi:hypothetical protein